MSVNCTHQECVDSHVCKLEDDLTWPLALAAEYYDRLLALTTEPTETYHDVQQYR